MRALGPRSARTHSSCRLAGSQPHLSECVKRIHRFYTDGMPRKSDEDERAQREAEELESFERRAEWWELHYGVPPEEADERTRKAVEETERSQSEADDAGS
jgi:hypothetical protein